MGALALINKTAGKSDAEVQMQSTEQYLSFQLGGETFAIGIRSIREILEYEYLTEVPMMPDFLRGVMNLRGAVVPVTDLALRFGRARTELGRRTCVVIVEVLDPETDMTQLIGVLVDAVHEVLTIALDDIERAPQFGSKLRTEFISGMACVENRFIVLLDISRVLSVEEMSILAGIEHDGEMPKMDESQAHEEPHAIK
ncbi:chemotaxis protein CheW [Deefgea sp. CFH1-16]|nr:chemotaxis protein CheW [Deefgea sp. CFH1-16]